MIQRSSHRKQQQRRPLSRSKSMTAVTAAASSSSPVASRRDAHIAAALAHRKDDMANSSCGGSPSRCVAPRRSIASEGTESGAGSIIESSQRGKSKSSDHYLLERQQSVRFVGPQAVRKKPLAARAKNKIDLVRKEHIHHPLYVEPSERSFDSSGVHDWSSLASSKVRPTHRHTGMSSEGSHFKANTETSPARTSRAGKLRKSRSMFSALPAGAGDASSESRERLEQWLAPDRDMALLRARKQADDFAIRNLGAFRSMEYIKPRTPTLAASAAASKAPLPRGSLPRSASTQKLTSHSSLFSRSKHKRAQSTSEIPHSLRNSSVSTDILASTESTATPAVEKSSGFRHAARKVSRDIKHKIKGFFGRSKSNNSGSLTLTSTNNSQTGFSTYEQASLSRVRSHMPSVHSVSFEPQSRRGSLESIEDEATQVDGERSRVTSWADSSTCTGATSQHHGGDWAKQRLSVINEGGSHGSSTLHLSRVSANAHGLRSASDNKRVYSALAHRLDQMSKEEQSHPNPTESVTSHGTVKTIRRVSEDDVFVDSLQAEDKREKASAKSPPERASPRALSTRSSAFFASPSNHLFRTQSPYRKALQQSMSQASDQPKTDAKYLSTLSTLVLPTRQPSPIMSEADGDIRMTSAESIYSCDSGGGRFSRMGHDTGTATVHNESPLRHVRSSTEDHDDVFSSRDESDFQYAGDWSPPSSGDWKTWLTSHVSKLETPRSESRGTLGKALSLPRLNHTKDAAEIHESTDMWPLETPETTTTNSGRFCSIPPSDTPFRWLATKAGSPAAQSTAVNDENRDPEIPTKLNAVDGTPSVPPLRVGLSEVTAASHLNQATPKTPRLSQCLTPRRGLSNASQASKRPVLHPVAKSESAQSSPGLSAAIERQFGRTLDVSRETHIVGDELLTETGTPELSSDEDADLDPQAQGSQRMVDLFLSSRRSRIASAASNGNLSSPAGVFV